MCLIYNESDGLLLCLLYLFVLRIMINKVFIKKMKKKSNFYTFSSYLVIILRSENDYNRFAILCKNYLLLLNLFLFSLICFPLLLYIYIYILMPHFQPELGWSVWGSLGWTKTVTPRFPVRPDWRIRTGFWDARLRTGTLYLIFFFLNRTGTCGYGPHLIT